VIPFIHPRFELFGVTLDWWLILVVLGIAAATEMGRARAIRKGLSVKLTVDGILFTAAMGFLFGHFVYQIFYNWENLKAAPHLILPWYGGYASTGGFLGAGIGMWLFLVVWKKAPVWAYIDNMAIAFSLGWVFGRLGCFTAHDHKGNLTDFPLAVTFPGHVDCKPSYDCWTDTVSGVKNTWLNTRHDLGLYEALFALALLILLLILDSRKQWFHGLYTGLVLVCYAPARFCMETLRATDLKRSDPGHMPEGMLQLFHEGGALHWANNLPLVERIVERGGLTPAQFGTFITFSLGLWILHSRRKKGRQDTSAEVARDYPAGTVPSPGAEDQDSEPEVAADSAPEVAADSAPETTEDSGSDAPEES